MLRYRSNSYTAALALKSHIELSEKFGPITEIKIEACMSISAPIFHPPSSEVLPIKIESLNPDEVKQ